MKEQERILARCILTSAGPAEQYDMRIASLAVIPTITLSAGLGKTTGYRVRVIFNTTKVDVAWVDRLIALFLADLRHLITQFRLKVNSIYIDHFDGKPYENFEGDRAA